MPYINISAASKEARNAALNTALGSTPYVMIYSGSPPVSPDVTVPAGNLLAALPCSDPFGSPLYFCQSASVASGGSGGTNGSQTVSGSTGSGTVFSASVTIASGSIASVNSITAPGAYSVAPTNLSAEPVTGAGLAGATLALGMSAILVASAISQENASATGTAAFARLAANNTAGGAGIVDLDVGTSGASVTINSTALVSGDPVSISTATIAEA